MPARTETVNAETDDSAVPSRRSFLTLLMGLIVSGISAVIGIASARFAILPAISSAKSTEPPWMDLGALAEIPEGKAVRRSVIVAQEAGWGRINSERLVWIRRKGETVTVFSAVCPHLGCTVNTAPDSFVCACHSSRWSADGAKISGPTPRNLDVLEHRVEGDTLQVRYQSFKQGTAEKEVIG